MAAVVVCFGLPVGLGLAARNQVVTDPRIEEINDGLTAACSYRVPATIDLSGL